MISVVYGAVHFPQMYIGNQKIFAVYRYLQINNLRETIVLLFVVLPAAIKHQRVA